MRGERVDFITSSKALAIPQAKDAIKLVELFGFKVCAICDDASDDSEDERKRRYANNHIFYGDLGSFQRDLLLTDYLGKNIRPKQSDRLIVDEVDSMFIDNADKVLYIAHSIHDLSHLRIIIEHIWLQVCATRIIFETAQDVKKIAAACQAAMESGSIPFPKHLKEFIDARLTVWIKNAYLANRMDVKRQYSVPTTGEHADKPIINDLLTGVEQEHSQWSNGLHQFVQLKESKALTDETLRAVFISNVSYFERYKSGGRLNGMSGTLGKKNGKERELLSEVYGANFFTVPQLNEPRAVEEEANISGTPKDWKNSIVNDVKDKLDHKRAVLIICEDKKSVEDIEKELRNSPELKGKTFKIHIYDSLSLANQYNDFYLQPGDIIIATNIAGRGTDLKIDDKSEPGIQLEKDGGLHVISTYMYSNERIEIQGEGRAGRKGQRGSSKFCVFDSRYSTAAPISIEQLKEVRDQNESLRLDDILRVKIPRLTTEQSLLDKKYHVLQKKVIKYLEDNVPSYQIEFQVKSLQNRWAMWLEKNNTLLDDAYKTFKAGNPALFDAFKEFDTEVMVQLNADDERLVVEPGELTRLGRCLMANDDPGAAIRCFNKASDANPDFSAFAHYYRGQAIIQRTGDKQAAFEAFKKAEPAFGTMQDRLMAANDTLQFVNSARRKQGEGLPVDTFTKHNVSEVAAIQIHLNAIRGATGDTLSAAQIQAGAISSDEAKKVFLQLCENLPDYIRTYRVSEQAEVKLDASNNAAFYHDGKPIELPKKFEYCKAELFTLFRASKTQANRKLLPKALGAIILNAAEVLEQLKSYLVKDGEQYTFTAEALVKIKEYMRTIVLNDNPQNKELLESLVLTSIFPDPKDSEKIKALLLKKLEAHETITFENLQDISLQLSKPIDEKIFRKLVMWLHASGVMQNNLNVVLGYKTRYAFHNRSLEELILLFSDKPHFVKKDMDLPANDEDAALHLWAFLEKNELVHNPVVDFPVLSNNDTEIKEKLENIENEVCSKIESIIADVEAFYLTPAMRESKNKKSRIDLRASEQKKAKKAKDSNAHANTQSASETQLPPEEKLDAEDLSRLSQMAKREAEVRQLCTSINTALKKSIGTLNTIHKVELKSLSLHDFYSNERLPPIVLEYAQKACADVLNLIEQVDKDKAWREALIVALIGLAQVVAGAMIIACCPAAEQLGRILINEGIGDISFAVQSHISGNFSWKAYREHKMQSLAMSVMAAGVASTLKSTPITGPIDISGSAIAKAIMNELMQAAITVAVNIGTNFVASNIAEQLVRAILDVFRKDFREDVKKQISAEFENVLTALYKKIGKERANAMLDDIIHGDEFNIAKWIAEDLSTQVMSTVGKISGAVSGITRDTEMELKDGKPAKVDVGNSGLNAAIDAASVISECLKWVGYAKSFGEIISTSTKLFEKLIELLKSELNFVKQEVDLQPMTEGEIKKDVEGKTEQVSDLILTQIEAQVIQLFTNAGSHFLSDATDSLVKSARTAVAESVDSFWKVPSLDQDTLGLDALIMAPSRDSEDPTESWKRTPGLSLKLDELDDAAKQAIYTGDDVLLPEEVQKMTDNNSRVVMKNEKCVLVDECFGGGKKAQKAVAQASVPMPAAEAQKMQDKIIDTQNESRKVAKIKIKNKTVSGSLVATSKTSQLRFGPLEIKFSTGIEGYSPKRGFSFPSKFEFSILTGEKPIYSGAYGEISAPKIAYAVFERNKKSSFFIANIPFKIHSYEIKLFGRTAQCQLDGELHLGSFSFEKGGKPSLKQIDFKGDISCQLRGPSLFGHSLESYAKKQTEQASAIESTQSQPSDSWTSRGVSFMGNLFREANAARMRQAAADARELATYPFFSE